MSKYTKSLFVLQKNVKFSWWWLIKITVFQDLTLWHYIIENSYVNFPLGLLHCGFIYHVIMHPTWAALHKSDLINIRSFSRVTCYITSIWHKVIPSSNISLSPKKVSLTYSKLWDNGNWCSSYQQSSCWWQESCIYFSHHLKYKNGIHPLKTNTLLSFRS